MDHRAKLEWAKQHLDILEASIKEFVDGDSCKLGVRFDVEANHYVACLREVKEVPSEWSLMVGDIVHNMRSTLDSVTYALARKNLGRPPTEAEVKQIQFV